MFKKLGCPKLPQYEYVQTFIILQCSQEFIFYHKNFAVLLTVFGFVFTDFFPVFQYAAGLPFYLLPGLEIK